MRDRDGETEGIAVHDGAPAALSDDPRATTHDSVTEPTGGGRAGRRAAAAASLIAVVALAVFLGFGSVTLEAGTRSGRSLRVVEVWRCFLADPPAVGHATLLRVVVFGAIVTVLLGAALGLWLAVTATDDPERRLPAGNADDA